jgi:hypothetical protein
MGDRPSPESCASPDVAGERHEVDLTEPLADLSGLARDRVSAGPVSLDRAQQRRGDQHIAELRALAPAVIDQPTRPREPAAAAAVCPPFSRTNTSPLAHRTARSVPVGRRGFDALLRWARAVDGERVWALEDCRHVSGGLERFLIARGERVLRIPTHLIAKARKSARVRGKSDAIDALNVARAALREGLGTFPVAQLDGPEPDLRLLVDHRERLVRHRVELNSTLLWHLHDLGPELMLPGGALFSKKCSTRIGRRLARAEQTMRVRIARDQLRRLRELTLAVRRLEHGDQPRPHPVLCIGHDDLHPLDALVERRQLRGDPRARDLTVAGRLADLTGQQPGMAARAQRLTRDDVPVDALDRAQREQTQVHLSRSNESLAVTDRLWQCAVARRVVAR